VKNKNKMPENNYLADGAYSCPKRSRIDLVKVLENRVDCTQCFGPDCIDPRDQGVDPCYVWNEAFLKLPSNDIKKLEESRNLVRNLKNQHYDEVEADIWAHRDLTPEEYGEVLK
jgi:hypothetical protein